MNIRSQGQKIQQHVYGDKTEFVVINGERRRRLGVQLHAQVYIQHSADHDGTSRSVQHLRYLCVFLHTGHVVILLINDSDVMCDVCVCCIIVRLTQNKRGNEM